LLNYANLLSKSGQTEKAATTLERLLGYNPSYATAQRNLGLIYGKLGRNPEAMAQLEKYLGTDVDQADRRHIEAIVAQLRQASGDAAIQRSPLQ
jgi:regulator of sirC expression with transglutaminase-like and TPR domain